MAFGAAAHSLSFGHRNGRIVGLNTRRFTSVTVAFLATLALGATPATADGQQAPACHDEFVPVALAAGEPLDYQVYGRLCLPPGPPPDTVQLLVPGITYDHTYWDLPGANSYTAAAIGAGFATFAMDRIGTGLSSHPFGALVTIDSNAFAVHQVITALRSGLDGSPPFRRLVLVGHSYGSWTAWYETSDYHDVDGVVLSGISHYINLTAPARLLPRLYPAFLDPAFQGAALDPSYLTTLPDQRYSMFDDPGPVDPALIAFDEAHKQTVTVGEIDEFPLILVHPLDIEAPVLLTNGSDDPLFCGLGGADCSTAQGLIDSERDRLGAHVPSIDAYILAGAGHDLNYAVNASDWFAAAQRWVGTVVG